MGAFNSPIIVTVGIIPIAIEIVMLISKKNHSIKVLL